MTERDGLALFRNEGEAEEAFTNLLNVCVCVCGEFCFILFVIMIIVIQQSKINNDFIISH